MSAGAPGAEEEATEPEAQQERSQQGLQSQGATPLQLAPEVQAGTASQEWLLGTES